MIFGVALLVVLLAIYLLLIKGWLWKLILFFAGWFGLYIGMRLYVAGAEHIAMTFSGYQFSWAALVPTIVCVCCLACTDGD